MSCRDRGLLVWMLSKPPEWQFTKKGILAEMQQDGERSIQAGVKRLQETGYLKITRERAGKGRIIRTIWNVYATPQLQNAVVDLTQHGKIGDTSPQLHFPAMENAANIKERSKKREAVPALRAAQLPEGIYFDHESGEFRRKGSA